MSLTDLQEKSWNCERCDFELVEVGKNTIAEIVESTIEIDPNWIFTAGPNPFAEQLIIEANDNADSQLIITDLMGRVLFNQRFSTSESINTKAWNAGMYLIQLRSEERYSPVTKVVKP